MQLEQAKQLAVELMDKHGLLDKGWHFCFDNAKRRLGCCNYTHRKISLSREYVSLNEVARVKNTILHEIAHALTQGHGHDHVWVRKAIEIGCDGKRCADGQTFNVPKGKYQAECPKCKRTFHKHRRPKYSSSCARCSGNRYNENYKLVFEAVTR
jgi:predicted SprT family Zn-dependent metalloprotease